MKHNLLKYWTLGGIYFLAVGILYLWAYWRSFNINIFEYAGLSDVAKNALIPIGSPFFFLFFGFVLAELISDGHSIFIPSGGADSPVGRFINKNIKIFIYVYLFFVAFLILTVNKNTWYVLPILLMFIPYVILKKMEFLSELKHDGVRSVIIMVIGVLPIYSFCQGKIDAIKILDNKSYHYIEKPVRLKYLGFVNEFIFMISLDNTEVIINKFDKFQSLKMKKFQTSTEIESTEIKEVSAENVLNEIEQSSSKNESDKQKHHPVKSLPIKTVKSPVEMKE